MVEGWGDGQASPYQSGRLIWRLTRLYLCRLEPGAESRGQCGAARLYIHVHGLCTAPPTVVNQPLASASGGFPLIGAWVI
jgi:hypothetical protein